MAELNLAVRATATTSAVREIPVAIRNLIAAMLRATVISRAMTSAPTAPTSALTSAIRGASATPRDDRDSYQRDDRSREYGRDDRDSQRDDRDFQRDDRQFSRDQRDDDQDSRRDSRDDFRSTSRSSSESRSSDVDFRVEDVRSADVGLWFNRNTRDGLVISDISSSGAITRFGFREGDQILSVNGWRVSDERQFIEYLFDPQFRNQRVDVVVWRGGRQTTIYVQPSLLIQEYTSASSQSDPLEEYGLVLDDRYPNLQRRVESVAADAGVLCRHSPGRYDRGLGRLPREQPAAVHQLRAARLERAD